MYSCLRRVLISLELSNFWTIHVLHDLISLPLLERETKAFMGIVLVVGLILVVLDLDKVGIDCGRVKRQ